MPCEAVQFQYHVEMYAPGTVLGLHLRRLHFQHYPAQQHSHFQAHLRGEGCLYRWLHNLLAGQSQLGQVSEIQGTDKIEIERSGASYCATIDELISYIGLEEFAEALSEIIG